MDVGCSKDGLWHACECDPYGRLVRDMRERVNKGDKVSLWVKAVAAGKFCLTARDPVPQPVPQPAAAPAASALSAAALAATAAATERTRQASAAREAAREREEDERRRCAERKARAAELEAAMVAEAKEREATQAAAREAAGLVLPAAEVLRGVQQPPAPKQLELEVLVEKVINGKRRVLYKMPWKLE